MRRGKKKDSNEREGREEFKNTDYGIDAHLTDMPSPRPLCCQSE